MARPKGSKNKKRVEKKIKDTPPMGVETKEGCPPERQEWKPEPKVDVLPPKDSNKVCGCGHKKEVHYGGSKGHCNTSGCLCQEFK